MPKYRIWDNYEPRPIIGEIPLSHRTNSLSQYEETKRLFDKYGPYCDINYAREQEKKEMESKKDTEIEEKYKKGECSVTGAGFPGQVVAGDRWEDAQQGKFKFDKKNRILFRIEKENLQADEMLGHVRLKYCKKNPSIVDVEVQGFIIISLFSDGFIMLHEPCIKHEDRDGQYFLNLEML